MAEKFVPKLKKLLTRPTLKMTEGTTRYVLIESPMFIGKDIKDKSAKAGDAKKEPATVINVIDLETGEPAQIVLNAVVKSVFHDEYPSDAYVGKAFSITKQAKQPGKQYHPFAISEIEVPEAAKSAKK